MTEREYYTALANLQWFLKNNYREPEFHPESETFVYGDGGMDALGLTEEGLTEATPLESRPEWERPLHEALKARSYSIQKLLDGAVESGTQEIADLFADLDKSEEGSDDDRH